MTRPTGFEAPPEHGLEASTLMTALGTAFGEP
jgi:hypothetical protein